MKKIIMALMVISNVAYAAPELKGDPNELKKFLYPDDTIISVSANAEETVYSDEATVNLIITTEKDTLSDAMKSNSSLRDKVRAYLIDKGISPEKINNSKFSSSPQYGWFGKKPSSYKIVNRVAVVILDESHLQDIAELSDMHEEIVLSGVTFEHTKKDEYGFMVKEKALAKILKRKAYYEKSLGIVLTPFRFHENKVNFEATTGAGLIEEVIVTGIRTDKSGYSSRHADYAPPRVSSFDEVKYSASITVDFKVNKVQ